MSVSAFILFILYVKPIRSLLIQRIPAGSSFRLLAQTFYSHCGFVHRKEVTLNVTQTGSKAKYNYFHDNIVILQPAIEEDSIR